MKIGPNFQASTFRCFHSLLVSGSRVHIYMLHYYIKHPNISKVTLEILYMKLLDRVRSGLCQLSVFFGLPPLPSTGSQQSQPSPGPVAGPKFIADLLGPTQDPGRARYKINAWTCLIRLDSDAGVQGHPIFDWKKNRPIDVGDNAIVCWKVPSSI